MCSNLNPDPNPKLRVEVSFLPCSCPLFLSVVVSSQVLPSALKDFHQVTVEKLAAQILLEDKANDREGGQGEEAAKAIRFPHRLDFATSGVKLPWSSCVSVSLSFSSLPLSLLVHLS